MTINKNNTYLGAFDVIEKILFGSKYLNIYEIIFIMKKLPDQECQREIITKGKLVAPLIRIILRKAHCCVKGLS